MAALILFISRLAEKALPFFKLLRGSGPFTWTEEAEQAFQELKQHLTTLPILVAPELGETLFLYLAASSEAVSMVLVAERTVQSGQGGRVVSLAKDDGPTIMEVEDGPEPGGPDPNPGGPGVEPDSQGPKGSTAPDPDVVEQGEPSPHAEVRTIQKPVYYVSEVLHEAKTRYLETHKLIYAILIASRKLRHKIAVVISYPLRAILHNSNATGNIAKWVAELAEFQLEYRPRRAVKSQILADFIAE